MKYIVLLSGGIDSTTCLAQVANNNKILDILTLSIFYGQRHLRELKSSKDVAAYYGVDRQELDLSMVFAKSRCPLVNVSEDIPQGSYSEQQGKNNGVVKTYVPFRNGLMLSAAASYAMSVFPNDSIQIWIGAHADDAAGNAYPDCSADFINDMARAVFRGTDGKVRLYAPFSQSNKADVVKTGLALRAPYHLTWSCYDGGDRPCGKCGTCIDRAVAFETNGVQDPAL